jgi:hypothetical protein
MGAGDTKTTISSNSKGLYHKIKKKINKNSQKSKKNNNNNNNKNLFNLNLLRMD